MSLTLVVYRDVSEPCLFTEMSVTLVCLQGCHRFWSCSVISVKHIHLVYDFFSIVTDYITLTSYVLPNYHLVI